MITDEQRAEMLASAGPSVASAYTVGDVTNICVVYPDGTQVWTMRGDKSAADLALTAWLAAGGEIEHRTPEVPAPTLADYQMAVAAHVDTVAREAGYEGGSDCASYAYSTNATWSADATAFIAWRDSIWTASGAALAAAATSPPATPPSPAQFVASLPAIVWP